MCHAGFFLTDMTAPNPSPPVSYQCPLRPALPCIYGPVEYREERDLYERIDRLLHTTGVAQACISAAFAQSRRDWTSATPAAIGRFGRYASIGLRCAVARSLTGLSLRGLTIRAAAIAPVLYLGETATQPAGLDLPLVADDLYFDATCLKAPIHLPTDWVLLRDAVRTLMPATACIRRAGLKVRMPQEPLAFLSDINALCMQMAAQRRRPDSKKNRKATLRLMKKLTAKVAGHARAHRELLTARRSDTALSEKQAARITARIDNILTQLPDAIRQAHERIIGERQVPNDEKILSLYEPDIDVIVRGKAGAEVEFGSKLWLGEMESGLIVDYILLQESKSDPALLAPALERLKPQEALKAGLKTVFSDRGIQSAANEKLLADEGLRSGLCPRQPSVLAQRLRDEPWLRAGLKRRGATETRIAIFKNVHCQGQLREKTHGKRELAIGRAVLAHNLYILAKLQIAQEKASRQAIAKSRERQERREAA